MYGFFPGGRVHKELRSMQEDARPVLRGAAVRRGLCQVQGQDDSRLREHRVYSALPEQT